MASANGYQRATLIIRPVPFPEANLLYIAAPRNRRTPHQLPAKDNPPPPSQRIIINLRLQIINKRLRLLNLPLIEHNLRQITLIIGSYVAHPILIQISSSLSHATIVARPPQGYRLPVVVVLGTLLNVV